MPSRVRSLLIAVVTLAVLSAAVAWQTAYDDGSERIAPLRGDGSKYWRGNLHTHSFWSDGDDFPEMIADWYKRHGYQFLAMTDHNVLSEGERWLDIGAGKSPRQKALDKYLARFGSTWVETREDKGKRQVRLKPLGEFRSVLEEPGRFLMIPGEEITHRFAKAPVHINAINLRDVIRPVDGDNVLETIRVNHRLVAEQRKKAGQRMIASLNHPNFGWGVRAEDMVGADELRYFEIYNGHPGVRNYGDDVHAGCERMWDIVLALRLGKLRLGAVYGLATDDAHGYHAFGIGKVNPGRGWVMVRAPYLSAEAIVKAMEAGDFYSSTGVTLKDIRRQDDFLTVTIQPEKSVTYRTQFIATLKNAPLASTARLGSKGQPLGVTETYSPEIGKVVAETGETQATYRLTGEELYVRARIISTKPHPNPYAKGDVEVAWTQPFVP